MYKKEKNWLSIDVRTINNSELCLQGMAEIHPEINWVSMSMGSLWKETLYFTEDPMAQSSLFELLFLPASIGFPSSLSSLNQAILLVNFPLFQPVPSSGRTTGSQNTSLLLRSLENSATTSSTATISLQLVRRGFEVYTSGLASQDYRDEMQIWTEALLKASQPVPPFVSFPLIRSSLLSWPCFCDPISKLWWTA